MSSERLRKLVEQIQKTAQPARSKGDRTTPVAAPATGGGTGGGTGGAASQKPANTGSVPTRGGTKPSGGGGYYVAPNPEVRQMQIAMQGLAGEVMRDAISKTMGPKPKDVNQQQGDDVQRNGKKGFNDFITEQYLGTLDDDKRGVEWAPSATNLKAKKETETDPYELDVVMNTIKAIGTGAREFAPDGNWQFRTDNALRNMLGFAYALLQLAGDFGFDSKAYDMANWRNFQEQLSGYQVVGETVKLSQEEKAKRADIITKHLKAIGKLYNEFRLKVTSNPSYRPLIEGDRGYEKYNQVGTSNESLSKPEQAIAQNQAFSVPGLTITPDPKDPSKNFPIRLTDISSAQAYLAFMKSKGLSEEDAKRIFTSQIVPAVEKA